MKNRQFKTGDTIAINGIGNKMRFELGEITYDKKLKEGIVEKKLYFKVLNEWDEGGKQMMLVRSENMPEFVVDSKHFRMATEEEVIENKLKKMF